MATLLWRAIILNLRLENVTKGVNEQLFLESMKDIFPSLWKNQFKKQGAYWKNRVLTEISTSDEYNRKAVKGENLERVNMSGLVPKVGGE
ncbi:MAG TPA: hypothetical protein GX711_00590 [Clostridia bacterium]|nr:hypothetical protein [Clostridia bacterium]